MKILTDKTKLPCLTRYLYNKNEVYDSLLLSLLDHDIEQSLFWGYELYHSGFKRELFDYLIELYRVIYKSYYPRLDQRFMDMLNEWYDTHKRNHQLVGSIIFNLACRDYDVLKLVTSVFKTRYKFAPTKKCASRKKRLFVVLHAVDVNQYETVEHDYAWKTLPSCCKYEIRTELTQLLQTKKKVDTMRITYIEMLRSHYLYFTKDTPIWRSRISDYRCKVNNNKHTITFYNEDDNDNFYKKWDFEPDEQSNETIQKITGANMSPYTIHQFANKYNVKLKNHFHKKSTST